MYFGAQQAPPEVSLHWWTRQLSWKRCSYEWIWIMKIVPPITILSSSNYKKQFISHTSLFNCQSATTIHTHLHSGHWCVVYTTATNIRSSSKNLWKKGPYLPSIHYTVSHEYWHPARLSEITLSCDPFMSTNTDNPCN